MLCLKFFFIAFICLILNPVQALKCFICDGCGKFDMNTRQHVQTCEAGEFFCKKEEAEDGLGWTKIFKGCSASCAESDSYNNRVKCCTTDICNSSISFTKSTFKLITIFSLTSIFYNYVFN